MPKPIFKTNTKYIEELIRVDFAGEYGAKRIYEGQLDATVNRKDKELINDMYKSESVHYNYFKNLMILRRVRPTFLHHVWQYLGYGAGYISAKVGFTMLLTDAVEKVIENHYLDQINYLQDKNIEKELLQKIIQFREEEIHHKQVALDNIGQNVPLASILSKIIEFYCKLAIILTKKI